MTYIKTGTVKTKAGVEVGTFVEKQMIYDLHYLMDEKGIINQDERDKMMMMWGAVFHINRTKYEYKDILEAFAKFWKLQ